MSIHVGADRTYELSVGGVPVAEVYVGATKVWPEAVPTVAIDVAPNPCDLGADAVWTATDTSVGAPILTYRFQWRAAPGDSYQTVQEGPSNTYTRAASQNGEQVRVRGWDGYGQNSTWVNTNLTVNLPPYTYEEFKKHIESLTANRVTNPANTTIANAPAVFVANNMANSGSMGGSPWAAPELLDGCADYTRVTRFFQHLSGPTVASGGTTPDCEVWNDHVINNRSCYIEKTSHQGTTNMGGVSAHCFQASSTSNRTAFYATKVLLWDTYAGKARELYIEAPNLQRWRDYDWR